MTVSPTARLRKIFAEAGVVASVIQIGSVFQVRDPTTWNILQ